MFSQPLGRRGTQLRRGGGREGTAAGGMINAAETYQAWACQQGVREAEAPGGALTRDLGLQPKRQGWVMGTAWSLNH